MTENTANTIHTIHAGTTAELMQLVCFQAVATSLD
jgi:hypothetical protein